MSQILFSNWHTFQLLKMLGLGDAGTPRNILHASQHSRALAAPSMEDLPYSVMKASSTLYKTRQLGTLTFPSSLALLIENFWKYLKTKQMDLE